MERSGLGRLRLWGGEGCGGELVVEGERVMGEGYCCGLREDITWGSLDQ